MAVQQMMIHQFANLDTYNPAELQAFCMRNGLITDTHRHLYLREIEERIFFTEEDQRMEESFQIVNLWPYHQGRRLIEQSDLNQINIHKEYVRKFLESFSKGMVPHLQLSLMFRDITSRDLLTIFPERDTSWRYRICPNQAVGQLNANLEDLINIHGILEPFLIASSSINFKWTKKCSICGDFYQAKGEKAIYCSERCRSRARALKRRNEIGSKNKGPSISNSIEHYCALLLILPRECLNSGNESSKQRHQGTGH